MIQIRLIQTGLTGLIWKWVGSDWVDLGLDWSGWNIPILLGRQPDPDQLLSLSTIHHNVTDPKEFHAIQNIILQCGIFQHSRTPMLNDPTLLLTIDCYRMLLNCPRTFSFLPQAARRRGRIKNIYSRKCRNSSNFDRFCEIPPTFQNRPWTRSVWGLNWVGDLIHEILWTRTL